MKVVTAKMMSQMESKAYQLGCKDSDFMEQAGSGVAQVVQDFIEWHQLDHTVLLICGKGNNAGDAFVAGCFLLEEGYHVFAIQPEADETCSQLCEKNRKRFKEKGGLFFERIDACPPFSIILDGLFGTGFRGAVKEPYATLIEQANSSLKPVLAIDIPSGLDGTSGKVEGIAIQATKTIFLGLPKTGFFLQDGWNHVGDLQQVNFGLPQSIIDEAEGLFEIHSATQMAQLLPPIKRNRHKYQAGYVIGLAGSPSMPGAALLSSLAALRGGAGMVRLLYPKGMEMELANTPYELIKLSYDAGQFQEVTDWLEKPGATFIGPGLGRTETVRRLLENVIPKLTKPCVIDADALYFLAEETFKLPLHTILTPHAGEMQRLLHAADPLTLDEKLLQTCQEYAEKKRVTLILKGAPTFIFHPGAAILVNPTGDPGMATAGSGDVLTGLLASLLAQGLGCRDAAALGVYLHGLSGEYAAENHTSRGIIASDLIAHFSDAFSTLTKGV